MRHQTKGLCNTKAKWKRKKLEVLKPCCDNLDWKDGDATEDFIKHPKGIVG